MEKDLTFHDWCVLACEYQAKIKGKDAHDIYPYLTLSDAKLAFIDGISPENYKIL